jgi:acylphosphatase
VAGWVCNLPDGSVGVAVGGAPASVDALRATLAAGPPGASVVGVAAVGRVRLEGSEFEIARSVPADAASALR